MKSYVVSIRPNEKCMDEFRDFLKANNALSAAKKFTRKYSPNNFRASSRYILTVTCIEDEAAEAFYIGVLLSEFGEPHAMEGTT